MKAVIKREKTIPNKKVNRHFKNVLTLNGAMFSLKAHSLYTYLSSLNIKSKITKFVLVEYQFKLLFVQRIKTKLY